MSRLCAAPCINSRDKGWTDRPSPTPWQTAPYQRKDVHGRSVDAVRRDLGGHEARRPERACVRGDSPALTRCPAGHYCRSATGPQHRAARSAWEGDESPHACGGGAGSPPPTSARRVGGTPSADRQTATSAATRNKQGRGWRPAHAIYTVQWGPRRGSLECGHSARGKP
jgi:hypothetical protein